MTFVQSKICPINPQIEAVSVPFQQNALVATVYKADDENPPSKLGAVLTVGGPQYRVGAHQQFVKLAMELSKSGITTMLIDFMGMGDSEGNAIEYTLLEPQITTAVDFLEANFHIDSVYVIGLCDGATAALFAQQANPKTSGLILINPWVDNVSREARIKLTNYYGKRWRSSDFWRKLRSGETRIKTSLSKLLIVITQIFVRKPDEDKKVIRSLWGLKKEQLPLLILLSRNDPVAIAFQQLLDSTPHDEQLRNFAKRRIAWVEDADHTFTNPTAERCLQSKITEFILASSRSHAR